MLTILFIGISVSLVLYHLLWYWGHRGHRQIARGSQTLNALEAVQASYRAGDYQTGLQQSEALKRGSSKTPEYCFFRGTMLHQLGRFVEVQHTDGPGRCSKRCSNLRSEIYNPKSNYRLY